MTRIGFDALESAIAKELEEFARDSTDIMREAVDEVTNETVDTLKAISPKQTGSYAKGWKSQATTDTNTALTKTVHNRLPGLTHLLEDGHAKQNGGRVAGRQHIAPAEKAAIKSLETKLRQRL